MSVSSACSGRRRPGGRIPYPKLAAAAFGMNPEGVMIYLAGHVDDGSLPAQHGS